MVIGGVTAPDYFFFILSRRSFFYLSQISRISQIFVKH